MKPDIHNNLLQLLSANAMILVSAEITPGFTNEMEECFVGMASYVTDKINKDLQTDFANG